MQKVTIWHEVFGTLQVKEIRVKVKHFHIQLGTGKPPYSMKLWTTDKHGETIYSFRGAVWAYEIGESK